jgi:acyl-coenzyme A thioesterase 13
MTKLNDQEAAELMQGFIDYHASAIAKNNYDRLFYESLKTRSATVQAPGVRASATFAFKIPPTYTNQPEGSPMPTTHGGAIAMFFDMTTSLAIVGCNFTGWESMGASRDLNVTYLKPPVEGDDCIIEAEVLQIGKRLAITRGVMKREKDGVLLAICQHQKYMSDKPHYTAELPTKKAKL